jgi:hypothetical protein
MQLVQSHVEVVDVVQGERGEGCIEPSFVPERLEGGAPEDRTSGARGSIARTS